ncbi:unannotated protein [freshwater metagenome]|uniref:Unannotated protein n=1 Tax=freshwater metagenome TaxID=449393 RepID=A0A6J6JJA8_9ZZZZ|nr:hypothetical protein [Actinomycetota bacterium]
MNRLISSLAVVTLLVATPLSALAANPAKPYIPIELPIPQNKAITFANAESQFALIPETAWQNVQDVIAANPTVKIPTTIVIGPNTDTTNQRVTGLLEKEYRLWNGFKQVPSYAGLVYSAQDEAWAETKWLELATKLKLTKNAPQYIPNHLRAGCTFSKGVATECYGGMAMTFPGTNSGFAFYGVQEGDFWSPNSTEFGPISQVTHEYAHIMQFAQWIGSSRNSESAHDSLPCWFAEGQANAIGIAIVTNNPTEYLKARDNSVRRQINQKMPIRPSLSESGLTAPAITKFLSSQKSPDCYDPNNNGDYQLGFSVGYAAVEALVAIGGPQATMALLRQDALGMTWKKAFKSVYGISWKKAMTILGKVLAAEYAAKPMNHD